MVTFWFGKKKLNLEKQQKILFAVFAVSEDRSQDLEQVDGRVFLVFQLFYQVNLLVLEALEDSEYLLDEFLTYGSFSVVIHDLNDHLGRIDLVLNQFYRRRIKMIMQRWMVILPKSKFVYGSSSFWFNTLLQVKCSKNLKITCRSSQKVILRRLVLLFSFLLNYLNEIGELQMVEKLVTCIFVSFNRTRWIF